MKRYLSDTERAAAIADYRDSGDTITVVAARHGIARATLGCWVSGLREQIAYEGGWERRGGVLYPLAPERRGEVA